MHSLKRRLLIRDQAHVAQANEDLLPTPPELRTWTVWDYVSIWSGSAFDPNQWNTGSSFIDTGMNVSQTAAPVLIGDLIAATVIILMSRPGVQYFIGYPSLVRSTFGISGSRWFVALRGAVGIIWYGIQTYYCAQLFSNILKAVFGHRYVDWNPPVPASSGDAKTVMTYFVTWVLLLPLAFVHPSKLRRLFAVRAVIAPIIYVALFAWCAHIGFSAPHGFPGFQVLQPSPVQGGRLGWAVLGGINSVLGTVAPLLANCSDISRYARRPSAVSWPQGVGFFVCKSIATFLAIFSASFLQVAYGSDTVVWNMWDQLNLIMDNRWTASTRFAVVVIAAVMVFSAAITNAYANTVPFGADISALFPRYLTMRRAQIVLAFCGLAVVPWRIFSSGASFLTFLGSYTFFMAAVLGAVITDYYVVRRTNLHTPSLYDRNVESIYCYNRLGTNWRGFVAWFSGVAIILPGLVESYMPSQKGSTATKMYSTGWVLSTATSAVVYYILNVWFPVQVLPSGRGPLAYGQLASTNGYFEGEGPASLRGLTLIEQRLKTGEETDEQVSEEEKVDM